MRHTDLECIEVPLHSVLVDTTTAPTIVAILSISRAGTTITGICSLPTVTTYSG